MTALTNLKNLIKKVKENKSKLLSKGVNLNLYEQGYLDGLVDALAVIENYDKRVSDYYNEHRQGYNDLKNF